jgi:hypothetical protein
MAEEEAECPSEEDAEKSHAGDVGGEEKEASEAPPGGSCGDASILLRNRRSMLSKVLVSAMNSSGPPVRKKVDAIKAINSKHVSDGLVDGPVFCAVTGVELEDMCVEVRPAGRYSSHSSSSASALETTARDIGIPSDGDATSAVGCADLPPAQPDRHPNAYLSPLVVHTDLEHFFHMFWYCYKIEHVVRHMARCWLEDFNALHAQGTEADEEATATGAGASIDIDACEEAEEEEEEGAGQAFSAQAPCAGADGGKDEKRAVEAGRDEAGGASAASGPGNCKKPTRGMQELCEMFSKDQEELVKDMHAAMVHAFSHVMESIYAYPCMQKRSRDVSSVEQELPGTGAKESAKRKRVSGSTASLEASDQQPSGMKPQAKKTKVGVTTASSDLPVIANRRKSKQPLPPACASGGTEEGSGTSSSSSSSSSSEDDDMSD